MNRQVLERKKEALGVNHLETLKSLSNLGTVLESQGRHKEAEASIMTALAGLERELGSDHPETLKLVSNMAMFSSTQGHYDESEKLYKMALHGYEKAYGKEDRSTLRIMDKLSEVLLHLGK